MWRTDILAQFVFISLSAAKFLHFGRSYRIRLNFLYLHIRTSWSHIPSTLPSEGIYIQILVLD